MTLRPYEISLWTYNDNFITILTSSDSSSFGETYENTWEDNINGEGKLTFTIPIIYRSPLTGEVVTNEKWYDELKKEKLLANEKKVKLIFNKLEKKDGNYIHEIHEFVIESLVEERTDAGLTCKVECVGAPFKELGKTGYELALSLDDALLEEDPTEINPTLEYWLDQVFPPKLDDEYRLQWDWKVQMSDDSGGVLDKVYENNPIQDWKEEHGVLVPIYASEPIEKARFIDVKESNRYNITQTIAETFEIFVRYEYKYENDETPFRATKKTVIFYDKITEPTEYSITYGNNELGFSRNSNSVDVVTKMFIASIDSEHTDDGVVTVANARSNKTQDDFILNFDYFIESGQMSSVQEAAIPTFEHQLRNLNQTLKQQDTMLFKHFYKKLLLENDISNYENKRDSANDNIIDMEEKLLGFDAALSSYLVTDTNIITVVRIIDGITTVVPRRKGVISSTLTILTMDNVSVPSNQYTKHLDTYGYVDKITFTTLSVATSASSVKLSYKYDLLNFYRYERATYQAIKAAAEGQLVLSVSKLSELEASIETLATERESNRKSKKDLITRFNNTMAPFLKEGVWNDSTYQPAFQGQVASPISFVFDPILDDGTNEARYVEGITTKYYDYILLSSTSTIEHSIENLVVMEHFTENTIAIRRELRYGAQWVPQFIYPTLIHDTSYATVADLIATNPSPTYAYFVTETSKVYHKPDSTWVLLPPQLALVFERDIKLDRTGHSYYIDGQLVAANIKKSNIPFTVAVRRWVLTSDGTYDAPRLENFQEQTASFYHHDDILRELTEFEDYYYSYNREVKSVVFL